MFSTGADHYRLVCVWWKLAADTVVVVHLAYLAFIPLGGFLAWRWRWVLPIHLTAVMIGLISITVHFDCPLTTWEQSFRRHAEERPYANGFIDHYLTGRVYPHGYDWLIQVLFAVGIVGSYLGLLVRARRSSRAATTRP
jgi:hypothetical protein